MTDAPSGGSKPGGKVVPYISAETSLPELTIGTLLLGALLSVILGGANAYLGMFAGMTVSASVPAAVISMAIFRAIRRGNILQNNGVQTAAASGEGLASGVIFTLPAVVILGTWSHFNYLETTMIAGFGGLLGVLFTIPLRRALIIDQPLQFPEGVATAEVLKVGSEGGGGVGVLALTGVVGVIIKVGSGGLKLWTEVAAFGATLGKGGAVGKSGVPAYFGLNASPALLSVGYIVGFNVALVIFLGAIMNRWVALPLFAAFGDPSQIVSDYGAHTHAMALAQAHASYIDAHGAHLIGTVAESIKDLSWLNPQLADPFGFMSHDPGSLLDVTLKSQALGAPGPDLAPIGLANAYHGTVTRFLGVGGMLVGGLWSLFKLRKSLLGGITAGLEAYKRGRKGGGGNSIPRTERDMPMNIILALIILSVIPLFFIFHHITDSIGISAVMAVVMLVAGFLFSAVASYMAGLVGSSNNPVSGITVSTVLISALMLLLLGATGESGAIAAILIGGVVCCAAAIGGDNLQDLKCGQLVGSTPWKQQVMQILGVVVAAFVLAPILDLLNNSYGIGVVTPEHPHPLQAPQATLMSSVAHGVFAGGLPWTIIAIGAGFAAVVIAIDLVLEKRQSGFRMPVMAFAVGVYLPFDLNVPIMMGGVVALIVQRYLTRTKASPERRAEVERMGLLAAAGFITGEALTGIALAIPVAATGNAEPLALFDGQYSSLKTPALVLVAVSLFLLYKLALRPTPVAPGEPDAKSRRR